MIKNLFTIKRIIIIAINVLCLIAFFICLGISSSIRTPLRSQQAANAWAGQSGERYSQISAFFEVPSAFDMDGIRQLRSNLNSALLEAALESSEDTILYTDAWSSKTTLTVMSQRSNQFSIKAVAVGGDFFVFHPLNLRDGSYLSPNDVMKDRVVIDEELAWRLFGAVKVAGFEIIINNRPFVVSGVITREKDFAGSAAYKQFAGDEAFAFGAGLFMTYDALVDMTEGTARIETYEIVLPNPISGFAMTTFEKTLNNPAAHLVENTSRFTLGKMFDLIGSFGERSMRNDALVFPYWENAARYAEDWLAFILILSIIFLIFPVVSVIIYIVILIRFGVKHAKLAIKNLIKKKDDRAYEKFIQKHSEDFDANDDYSLNDIIREVNDEIY